MRTVEPRNIFADMKAGDRVWVGRPQYGKDGGQILPVESTTRTLIRVKYSTGYIQAFRVTQWDHDKTWHACQSPSISFGSYILDIATKAECAKWDAEVARAQALEEASKSAKDARDAKMAELRELFGPNEKINTTYVRNAVWTADQEAGKFDLTFHGLTEEEIRSMAERLHQ